MPTKDPNFWAYIVSIFQGIEVAIYASLVALLRVLFDAKEKRWQRIALEVLLSGLIAKGADQIAIALGYSHLDVAIGAAIGLLGVENIRYFGRKYLTKKIEK